MMNEQIASLHAQITAAEHRVHNLQTQSETLTNELRAFKAEYDQRIAPYNERLKMVEDTIRELKQQLMYQQGGWQPPAGYVSVEEQYARAWTKPNHDPDYSTPQFDPLPDIPTPQIPKDDIRTLYRRLARAYHPDHASDDRDRDYRHQVMAQINDAYANQDIRTLHNLARQKDRIDVETPIQDIELRELEAVYNQLRRRIFQLKQQIFELKNCDLMQLKVEVSVARARGRDMLGEMAEQLEATYRQHLQELYQLRREL